MRSKLVIPALAILTTAATPAFAQYGYARDPGYYGYEPSYYGPTYGSRTFRGAYNRGPVIGPFFYGDGWVPESIWDHSRTGGIDPNIRPPN
jgi:hypothetical protein